jgi:competence protein ComEC
MDGLFDVIENFQVGEFWLGRNPMTPRYRALIARIQEKQIPIRWVSSGQHIGGFTVLHPPADWIPRPNRQNDDSLVLLLDTGRATALLTGDIDRQIRTPAAVDVLKVPHHGSKGVRTRVRAAVRIISVGSSNPFGHPHVSALPALRTDLAGAVKVRLASSDDREFSTSYFETGRRGSFSVAPSLTESCLSCKLTMLFRSHWSE